MKWDNKFYKFRVFAVVPLIAVSLGLLFPGMALAGSSQAITYQGRILRPEGQPVDSGTITFTLKVMDASNNCRLWSETQTIDMTNSLGAFSLALGAGTRTDGGAHTLKQVFTNAGTLTALSCTTGTTYSPTSSDDRNLAVSFNDAGTVVTLSSMPIKSVPLALQAEQVSGYGIMNLSKISGVGSANVFSPIQHDFIYNLSAAGSLSSAPCLTGEILKYNGTAWACAADANGGALGDASYAAKGVVQFNTDAATSGLSVVAGVASVNVGTAVGQVVQVQAAGKLPILDGSNLTALSAAQITAGTLPIARGGTNSTTALNNNRLIVSNGGAITEAAALTNGQLMIGSTGAAPVAASLTAGSGISITPAAGGLTIAATGGGSVDLTSGVTGVLPIANGGTNSNTALVGSKMMISFAGKIVENANVISNSSPMRTDAGGIPSTGAIDLSTADVTGTLLATKGGTGQSSFTIGDILFASTTTALSKLAAGTNGYTLTSNGPGVAPSWQAVPSSADNLGNHTATQNLNLATFKLVGNGGSAGIAIDSSGNVGVGIAAPGAILDVSPTITSNADLKGINSGLVYNGGSTMSNYYGHYIAAPTGTGIITNKYALVTQSGAGNVGIGTTTPSVPLEVAGNINVGAQGTRTTATTNRGQQGLASTYILTANASTNIDWNDGNIQEINTFLCDGAKTITFLNAKDGAAYSLLLSGDAVHSGNCLFVSAGKVFKTPGGAIAPLPSHDVFFTFVVVGSTIIYNMTDSLY